MSTTFFQRQETARTNTGWLVILFLLAVLGIVVTAATVGYVVADVMWPSGSSANRDPNSPDPGIDPLAVALVCGGASGVVIILGSLYQIIALRSGGGSGVAESIGGRPLVSDTATADEKRLLNIVEEMAIASGTPVPPVYLLDEPGINAFAAGYRPNDAVLGVTRGAMQTLNREQMQGVIAHEFSHVLNGDMRMNIRMIGILHGVLLLSLIGRFMFHSLRFMGGSRSDDKGRAGIVIVMLVIGIALMLIGSIGSFIGGLIKAAVCRQREYLADASAVQFTRNPDGIGGALKEIAALSKHGRLQHPNASVASHLFFSQGVYEGLTGLLATHPPIEKRILAIDPQWDGNFKTKLRSRVAPVTAAHSGKSGATLGSEAAMGFAGVPVDADQMVPAAWIRDAAEHVGAPEEEHFTYSSKLLQSLHPKLRQAAGEPYSARALLFAMLLERDAMIAEKQVAVLRTSMPPAVVELTLVLAPLVQKAPEAARLPLVDLALPMLRRMSLPQYKQFIAAFDHMVRADNRLTIFEWALAQVLKRNLASQFEAIREVSVQYPRLNKLVPEASLMLTMLARVGQKEADVPRAFDAAASKLPRVKLILVGFEQCNFAALENALSKLRRTPERARVELLDACAHAVASDGIVKVREAELLRGIADLLECPMPPIIDAHWAT